MKTHLLGLSLEIKGEQGPPFISETFIFTLRLYIDLQSTVYEKENYFHHFEVRNKFTDHLRHISLFLCAVQE